MRSRFALLLPLSLTLAGCGNQACLLWSEADGACPSQLEASAFWVAACYGDIESVDSEGTFDGDACCYDITKRDNNGYDVPCAEPAFIGDPESGSSSGGF